MTSEPVAVASALASSVLPVPAGPSTSSGLPSRSARKTVVAICASGRYPASASRFSTSPTEENWGNCDGGRGNGNLSAGVTVAGHDVGGRGELGQAERAPGVQLLGGDADLGAEAELAAVGESGGGVHQDRGGIDAGDEVGDRRGGIADDGL